MRNTSIGGNAVTVIKSFLYLDEYKMYSISSQLFGGLTEYLIGYQGTQNEEAETQRGPIGSGRVMADILKSESRTQEKKYLHDYSYTLFEQHLKEENKVHSVSVVNIMETIQCIEQVGFVEVRAKAVFNDMNAIKDTIEGFNDLGEALAFITNFEELNGVRQQMETLVKSTSDRNQKAQLTQRLKSLQNIKNLAHSAGLRQDPDLIEKLGYLLTYGFQDQFEVQMTTGGYTFSANLKREHLREDEHLLVRKYSRFPEKQFVLFGTIAQSPNRTVDSDDEREAAEDEDPQHLKKAIMRMVEALSAMEHSFSGKLANEIIIDPIALYHEI